MTRLPFVLMIFLLALAPFSAARAQLEEVQFEEPLPIEVSILYKKLLNEQPNYDFLIYSNPAFVKDPSKFGQVAVIEQQRATLEKIYAEVGPDKFLYTTRKISALGIAPDGTLMLTAQDPDKPIVYTLFGGTERYAVFIRNISDIENLKPPFETKELNMISVNIPMPVLLTLKPIASDKVDFDLEDGGTPAHVIVADVVQIRILSGDQRYLLVEKRLNGWKPAPPPLTMSPLIEPDLIDSLSKKK